LENITNLWWKKAEEAAVRSIKDWENTFDSIPYLIAIIDDKYRFIRVNKAMATRLGMIPEECVGLTCYSVVHGADAPFFLSIPTVA